MTDTAQRQAAAESCLVSGCAVLADLSPASDNFMLWLERVKDVLPDCHTCHRALVPMRAAADSVCTAKTAKDRTNAMSRLRYEVRIYYQKAAAARFERWKEACAQQESQG
jgi:hypothetical protein